MNDNLIKWLSITDRRTKMYMDRILEPLGINSSQHIFLIKKHNEKDKRTCRLYPTDKTEQAYTIIHQTIQKLNHQLLSGFTTEEQESFLTLLQRAQWNALSLNEFNTQGGNENTYE